MAGIDFEATTASWTAWAKSTCNRLPNRGLTDQERKMLNLVDAVWIVYIPAEQRVGSVLALGALEDHPDEAVALGVLRDLPVRHLDRAFSGTCQCDAWLGIV